MRSFSHRLARIQFSQRSVPLALLTVCVLAFGLLIPFLGFYQDDWHFIYYAATRGAAGLNEFFIYDGHPLAAWIYTLSFNLLGYNPLAWQIYSLLWRWLAVVLFWMVLDSVWPTHKRAIFLAAVIFAANPVFYLQPQAISYFEVWISYSLLWLSFYFSIQSIKQPKRFLQFTAAAILFKVIHSFTSEYTWGTELMRPLLLWLALPVSAETGWEKIRKVIQVWWPHLAILAAMFIWRGLIYSSPVLNTPRDPRLFDQLFRNPMGTIGLLLNNVPADLVLMLVTGWYKTLTPVMLEFGDRLNLGIFLVQLLSGAAMYFFLTRLPSPEEDRTGQPAWIRSALLVGAATLLAGLIPFYTAGYFIHLKVEPWNGRVILGSLPGVALLMVALLEWMLATPRKRAIVAAILTALMIGWHLRVANDFRWAWAKQLRFYQQLTWRAPAITPGTALISDQEVLYLMGDYPTGFAINAIYQTPLDSEHKAATWFFALYTNLGKKLEELPLGTPISDRQASLIFLGNSRESLYFTFMPEQSQCLWILSPQTATYKPLDPILRTLAGTSGISRIQPEARTESSVYQSILPGGDEANWCYYFEKADLARQSGKWQTVISLWEASQRHGLEAGHGLEYIPFIEAFARQGQWAKAAALTRQAGELGRATFTALCPLWDSLAASTPDDPEKSNALNETKKTLACPP